jgi:hypothetical protein
MKISALIYWLPALNEKSRFLASLGMTTLVGPKGKGYKARDTNEKPSDPEISSQKPKVTRKKAEREFPLGLHS